jgi:hypothetical protein
MNELIRDIAKKAGIQITPMVLDGVEYDYEDVNMDGSEDLKKFAELIIKECAIIANRADNTETEIRCMYDVITEHFGVEK